MIVCSSGYVCVHTDERRENRVCEAIGHMHEVEKKKRERELRGLRT
jgi:hypothetical protein